MSLRKIWRAHSAAFLVFSLTIALSCGVRNNPESVADAFCYRYFIELNQRGALELASGLAADNLRKEIKLLKGNARIFVDDREFHQLKPFIDYEMTQRTDQDGDHVSFIYEITIEPRQGNEKLYREIVLSTTRKDDRWTISNYEIESKKSQ